MFSFLLHDSSWHSLSRISSSFHEVGGRVLGARSEGSGCLNTSIRMLVLRCILSLLRLFGISSCLGRNSHLRATCFGVLAVILGRRLGHLRGVRRAHLLRSLEQLPRLAVKLRHVRKKIIAL